MNPVLPAEPAEGQSVTYTFPNGGGVLYETRIGGVLHRVTAPDVSAAQAHIASKPAACKHSR